MADKASITWEEARRAALEGRLERVLVACDRAGGAHYFLAVRPGPTPCRLVPGPKGGYPDLTCLDRGWVVELLTKSAPKGPGATSIAPF